MKFEIPQYVKEIIESLEKAGFEAFVVGGCVRDLMLGIGPKDWDVATNAKPEEIQKIFPDSVYENEFGTVGIKVSEPLPLPRRQAGSPPLGKGEGECKFIVEVTTYRIESKYTDKRHPDEIKFAKTLEEDLSRRDFTINAMAIRIAHNVERGARSVERKNGKERYALRATRYAIVDPFNGQEDLENKIIRAVGEADERFNEDALRMMRAVRFAVTLGGNSKSEILSSKQIPNSPPEADQPLAEKSKIQNTWKIEKATFEAIKKNAGNLKYISAERIKDELQKIILSNQPAQGIELLREAGLLKFIIPELVAGFDVTQSHHHYYGPYNTVYKHSVASLEKCPSEKLEVRLAALLHDIGKPAAKRGQGENATFYAHEYKGERIAREILERLKFPRAVIEKVTLLVRNHMFYYNVDEVGEAGVRRVIRKVGLENINDLIDVRISDRLGSGVPKAVPYKLRHFKFMVEKVSSDPISVKQLKINGNDLIEALKITPGPKIGAILDVMLIRVIDDPELNDKKTLLDIAKELNKEEPEALRAMARKKIEEEQEEEEKLMKKKYWVE